MAQQATYIGATDIISRIMMGQVITPYEALADPSPFVIERIHIRPIVPQMMVL